MTRGVNKEQIENKEVYSTMLQQKYEKQNGSKNVKPSKTWKARIFSAQSLQAKPRHTSCKLWWVQKKIMMSSKDNKEVVEVRR